MATCTYVTLRDMTYYTVKVRKHVDNAAMCCHWLCLQHEEAMLHVRASITCSLSSFIDGTINVDISRKPAICQYDDSDY